MFGWGGTLLGDKVATHDGYLEVVRARAQRRIADMFAKGQLPQALIARDINATVQSLEGSKLAARKAVLGLQLFERVWA